MSWSSAAVALVTSAMALAGGLDSLLSRPLRVRAGRHRPRGTHEGCYRSDDPAVPAVMIATEAPVRIEGATIEHAGEGVVADVDQPADLMIGGTTGSSTATGSRWSPMATS